MTAARWQRVRELLEEALDLPVAERGAFLGRECGDDAQLRMEIEALIAADERELAGSRLPAEPETGDWLRAQLDDAMLGVQIGDYRIIRLLGAGGMGMVYEAEQDNPRRTVALKFKRPGTATNAARFQLEAERLASLRHPGIVHVYGGGVHEVTVSGRVERMPYLVLEPVERALSITKYAERDGLDVDGRLALLLQACDAMALAHRRGVVHRDLKPENLLVDGHGRVKVIDFGIAGDRGETDDTPVAGTVRYMAPEQRAGDVAASSPAVDVFALGRVLEELISPEAIARNRELECIARRATATEPDGRYADALELARDLHDLQAHRPVAAMNGGRVYVMRKAVRRHRVGVVAAALVLIGLTTGIVGLVLGWQRSEALREQAEATATEAAAVVVFLQNALVAAQPWHEGRDATVLEFLESVAERIDGELGDRPGVAAVLHGTVGWSFKGLGRPQDAEPHLRRAVELLAESDTATPRQHINARYRLATNTVEFGRRAEAEPELAALTELAIAELGPEDDLTLTLRDFHALTLSALGRSAEAVTIQREVLAAAERRYGADAMATISRRNNLVSSLIALSRFDEAAEQAVRAVEQMREQFGVAHPHTQVTMQNLAAVRCRQERFAESEVGSREVLGLRSAMLGDAHPYTIITRYWLGLALLGQERWADALAVIEAGLDHGEALGPEHTYTLRLRYGRARCRRGLGDGAAATAEMSEVAAIAERIGGPAGEAIHREITTDLERSAAAEPGSGN